MVKQGMLFPILLHPQGTEIMPDFRPNFPLYYLTKPATLSLVLFLLGAPVKAKASPTSILENLQMVPQGLPDSGLYIAQFAPDRPSNLLPSPVQPLEEDRPEESPARRNTASEVLIQEIQIAGSSVFSEATLEAVVAPFEGKSLTPDDLKEVSDAVTQLYLDHGYFTSRAFISDQVLPETGVLVISVLERSADLKIEWLDGENWLQEAVVILR